MEFELIINVEAQISLLNKAVEDSTKDIKKQILQLLQPPANNNDSDDDKSTIIEPVAKIKHHKVSRIIVQDGELLEESGQWLAYKDSDEEPEAEVT